MSGISLELYFAQKVVFRAVEKIGGLYNFGCGWRSFVTTWIVVLLGLILFIEGWKRILPVIFEEGFSKIKVEV